MRVGELADLAGVNVETLRYYERRGLIPPPNRRASGHREYDDASVALLRTIKAVQQLGFTLAEIEELLELVAHRRPADELRRRGRAKLAEIDGRIEALTKMRSALADVIDSECDARTGCSCGGANPLPALQLNISTGA